MNRLSIFAAIGAIWTIPASAAPILASSFDGPNSLIMAAGSEVDGWTVVGPDWNSVYLVGSGYSEASLSFNPHSGLASLDLTGAGNVGPSAGIFKDISTTAGTTYDVTFFVGNATGSADGSGNSSAYMLASSVELLINGVSSGVFTNGAVTFHAVNWQQFASSFVAAGPTTRIEFRNATAPGDNYAGLDDVNITATGAVPEPATWAMMLIGFGVIGSALRRRQQTETRISYA